VVGEDIQWLPQNTRPCPANRARTLLSAHAQHGVAAGTATTHRERHTAEAITDLIVARPASARRRHAPLPLDSSQAPTSQRAFGRLVAMAVAQLRY
jgi:hypothetical protein